MRAHCRWDSKLVQCLENSGKELQEMKDRTNIQSSDSTSVNMFEENHVTILQRLSVPPYSV